MPIQQLLGSHEKDLGGGFMVRRLLPAAAKRSVGPFVFFDHFGPVTLQPGGNTDVRPHPHIGLATVTYLFEGAIDHRDSLGSFQRIEPGAINWMTAGRGIVHSERGPADLKSAPYVSHGLQLWVALPEQSEECEPAFEHTSASAIPEFTEGGARVRLLVGEGWGLRSPVRANSPTFYLDVALEPGAAFTLPAGPHELAVYPVDGDLEIDGQPVPARKMAALLDAQPAVIRAPRGARLMVLGGEKLAHQRFMWWNFVSSRKERIEQAKADWEAQRMGQVPGETEFIPLP
ncbi:MAG: pirin family protein [Candidatus Protistobacter heckmanni]|nr:pirin family protein [Candidatus Protistobacter heckmanni]